MDGLIVVGPPRCSQSLVAFALSQHPDTRLVFDATWAFGLGRGVLAVGSGDGRHAGRSALPAEMPAAALAARTGAFAASLTPMTPTTRVSPAPSPGAGHPGGTGGPVPVSWATVSSLGDVAVAANMFPDAVFVPVLRHPDPAVESLATKACGDGRYASRSAGYRMWTEATRALEVLLRARGTDRTVPVDIAELAQDPGATLTRALEGAGLDAEPGCAAVLDGVEPERSHRPPDGPGDVRAVALADHDHARRHVWPTDHAGGDPAAVRALSDALAAAGTAAPTFDDTASRYRTFVSLALPAGAVAAVISKGDPGLVELPGRTCTHLPAGPDGGYAGHHPADSAAACDALARAWSAGARWLVVPAASAWWLDHYEGFAHHLRTTARLVAHHEDLATVYELVDPAHH